MLPLPSPRPPPQNIVEPFASQVSSGCTSSAVTAASGNATSPAGNASAPAQAPSSVSLYQVEVPSTISAAAGRKLLGV